MHPHGAYAWRTWPRSRQKPNEAKMLKAFSKGLDAAKSIALGLPRRTYDAPAWGARVAILAEIKNA